MMHFLKPRTTLYSPPPSHALKDLAVLILPSPGSRRSITSPNETARSFRAWEGGGEYNVVRGLRKCFKMNTGVITAFADNEVGKLMEDFICQGGVDTSLIKWMKTDGIGRVCRNGLNFTFTLWL